MFPLEKRHSICLPHPVSIENLPKLGIEIKSFNQLNHEFQDKFHQFITELHRSGSDLKVGGVNINSLESK